MKRYFKLIFTRKLAIAYMILLFIMVTTAILSVGCSQIMVLTIDHLNNSMILEELVTGLVVYLLISVVQNIAVFFQTVLITYLNEQSGIEMKNFLVKGLFSKTLDYYSEKKSGDLQQVLLNDVMVVASFFTETIMSVFANAFMAIAAIAYLTYLQWDLLLIVLMIQPCILLIQGMFSKKVYVKADEYRENIGEAASFLYEIITNIVQYITFGLKDFCAKNNWSIQKQCMQKSVRTVSITAFSTTMISCMAVFVFVMILGFGGYKVSVGSMTIGMLVAFIQFSSNLLEPLLQLFQIKIDYEKIRPSLNRISEVLDCDDRTCGNMKSGIEARAELRNVSFSYLEDSVLLNQVSAVFEKGKIYCIAGKSGSGKTTICNLILRLCQPQEGNILIDGIDINEFEESYFYQNITYISQIPFIFNGTIKENICLDRKITNEKFWKSIEFAGLKEDIQKMSDGENYRTGDCGENLSVGQRQRIGLARAYVRGSLITVFDEPTASIGQEYTKWFIRQMESFKKERLVILISHDEEVKKNCDVVYRITEQGTLEKHI